MDSEIRKPKQKRAIEKKDKIIDAGFELICKNGYYNTNTIEIAKKAGVSTGIVYQYFKDKYDIFMEGLEKFGDDIFFPMLKLEKTKLDLDNYTQMMHDMIDEYIKNHKISKKAHEEITAMIHSNEDVAKYFYKQELKLTEKIKNLLLDNNFEDDNLTEKVHIMIGLVDNLCHEIIYHKHENMDYDVMTNIIIDSIKYLFKKNC